MVADLSLLPQAGEGLRASDRCKVSFFEGMAALVGTGALILYPSILPAAERARDPSVVEQRQALSAARRTAAQAERRSAQLEAQARAMTEAASRSRAEQVAAAAAIQSAEARIAAAESQVALIDRLRAGQRARLAEQQGPIIKLTAALQTMAQRPSALALVQPGSVTDMIHVRALLGSTLPIIRERTASLRAEVTRGNELRRRADLAVAELHHDREQLEIRRKALAHLEADQRRRSQQYVDSAMIEQDRVIAISEKARDITQLIADLGDQADIRARLASLPGPILRPAVPGTATMPAPPPLDAAGSGALPSYRLPVIGKLVSGMGEISDAGVRAKGITLTTARGAQVVAPAKGRIAFAGPFRSYAAIVIIDHDGGWTTLITGMRALAVKPGETIWQGSPIGTADGAQPRITVELRHAGEPVDILPIASAG
jgi:septal ring factor EnvC (AmiA/AmiB activator)